MANWNPQANDIFLRAAEIPSAADQRAFLDQECGGDSALQKQVESLLAASVKANSFLNRPAVDRQAIQATADYRPITEGPGSIIGPYKLMEQIGEGGFGLVFVAEQQQPVRRKVALKIIKPGMDTREVIARFEAERQALALMDHPHIARVLDAGTTDSGRPFFVMELVRGISIIEYCDTQQLTARQRLDLFLTVCQAVQHAHSKAIIHRDLKPSNILVAPHDGVPVVKVIDFGVAKAIGQQLTDKTIYTRFTQMIGTPLYMSPEQAEINALDVDIRSDIYSLGVLLYELLTGTTPFDRQRFQRAAYDEIRRIIKDEEPPKPSTRLSTLGETLSAISAQRKTVPGKLSALVKGDLDWIVMKALEKDRTRRYETTSTFAADVRRFLAEEPIEARPPSVVYRVQKFVRRNRGPVMAGSALLVVMLLGLAGTATGLVQARREATRARIAQLDAEQQRTRATEEGSNAVREKNSAVAARDDLRRALYAAQINLAQTAWNGNDGPRTTALLQNLIPQRGEADLRGFEWHFLNHQFRGEQRVVRVARQFVAPLLSHDGTRVAEILTDAAVDSRRTLKVWETATGKELLTIPLPQDSAETSNRTLDRMTSMIGIETLQFSPDGMSLTLSDPTRVTVLDLQSGQEAFHYDFPATNAPAAVSGVPSGSDTIVSSDGRRLLRLTRGGRFQRIGIEATLIDTESGKEIRKVATRTLGRFSRDGRQLAYDNAGQGLVIEESDTGKANTAVLDWNDGTTQASALKPLFSPTGGRILAIVRDVGSPIAPDMRQVAVWEVLTGTRLSTMSQVDLRSKAVWSPDGERFAIWIAGTNPGGNVSIANAQSGKVEKLIRGSVDVAAVAFSADGKQIIAACHDGTVRSWDAMPEKERPGTVGRLEILAGTSVDGRRAVMMASPVFQLTRDPGAGEQESGLHLFDDRGSVLAREDLGGPGEIVRLDHAGRRVAFIPRSRANEGRKLIVWDTATGKSQEVGEPLQLDSSFWIGLAFSEDDEQLAMIIPVKHGDSLQSAIRVFDASSGQMVSTTQPVDEPLGEIFFSPDRKTIYVGAKQARDEASAVLRAFDTATGRVRTRFGPMNLPLGRFSPSSGIALSRDGKYLAGAYNTAPPARVGTATVWDTQVGQSVASLRYDGLISKVRIRPDGRDVLLVIQERGRIPGIPESTVLVCDATAGRERFSLNSQSRVIDAVFSPDGSRIATLAIDGPIRGPGKVTLWDAESGRELLHVPADITGNDLHFSPDGRRLFFAVSAVRGGGGARIQSWDAAPRP